MSGFFDTLSVKFSWLGSFTYTCCWRCDPPLQWPLWFCWTIAMTTPKVGSMYQYMYVLNYLEVRRVSAIKPNDVAVFVAISSAPSNLGADSMAPDWWAFWRLCWPPDQRLTVRVNQKACRLSIKSLFTTLTQMNIHRNQQISTAIHLLVDCVFVGSPHPFCSQSLS